MRTLTNPNTTPVAQRLFAYICSLQGKNCLTGQMESGWREVGHHLLNAKRLTSPA